MYKTLMLFIFFLFCQQVKADTAIYTSTVTVVGPREWRPKITAEEALQLAKTYIQQNKIDISSYYLSVIKMDASWKMVGPYKKVDQQFWTLFWVKPAADNKESLAIAVPMDGSKVRQVDVTKDLAMKGYLSKVPEITLERALQLANEYIHTENLDMSAFFLYQVTFVASRGGWWVWWTNVKGGCGNYIEIDVSMDGKVRRRCSM